MHLIFNPYENYCKTFRIVTTYIVFRKIITENKTYSKIASFLRPKY